MKLDFWWLVNTRGSPIKMSFQVTQLSSASSSSVNKENITSANMSDEEPQDDQELVTITAAEKQSGTEHSGKVLQFLPWDSWGYKAEMGQRQHICLGSKIQLNCYSVTECILLSITELCSHFILSSPNFLLKAFIFSARIEIFLTHVSWLVGVNGKNFTSVWILRSSETFIQISNRRSLFLCL